MPAEKKRGGIILPVLYDTDCSGQEIVHTPLFPGIRIEAYIFAAVHTQYMPSSFQQGLAQVASSEMCMQEGQLPRISSRGKIFS
jgi:hypothetical protein